MLFSFIWFYQVRHAHGTPLFPCLVSQGPPKMSKRMWVSENTDTTCEHFLAHLCWNSAHTGLHTAPTLGASPQERGGAMLWAPHSSALGPVLEGFCVELRRGLAALRAATHSFSLQCHREGSHRPSSVWWGLRGRAQWLGETGYQRGG